MKLDENGEPVWRDGDVVKIRFVRKRDKNVKDGLMLSDEYEYIREDGYWPGEAEWSTHTDAEMTAAWHDARLSSMAMVEAPKPAITGDVLIERHQWAMDATRLRILERSLSMVQSILDECEVDLDLAEEIRAVLP